MSRRLVLGFALALVAGLGTSCSLWGPPGPKMPVGLLYREFASVSHEGQTRKYAMWVPKNYNESRKPLPMILFLHGFGERGDDTTKTLVHGPVKEAVGGRELPFIIVAPQCPMVTIAEARTAWKSNDADLMKIVAEVKRDYRVDPKRTYLTGISMGGFGTFAVAALHPGMFAAVAPICGGGDPKQAEVYKGTPFWIFHGDADPIVPPAQSRAMLEAMQKLGEDVKLTLYPGVQHDSWSVTYANPEFYDWLLAHRLK